MLHLAVDIHIDEMIATELSASNVTDGAVLPHLRKHTRQISKEISYGGAYDTRHCYETV
ncbi:Transposase [Candidatus Enterovibrio altilux]|uniref:Transposase n=1 Tax=Candidatus Enterovibrio altilux TaxID=1927128 RepID=A0A291B8T2_9GAMM|nr:Transposase [Candidatus Enterovibrio luxaltus]